MSESGVRLTREERSAFARDARRELRRWGHDPGYGLDDAAGFLAEKIEQTGRFEDVPYTVISDYAYGLAAWVAPREAHER